MVPTQQRNPPNEGYVYLGLFGTFDPDEVTALIGVRGIRFLSELDATIDIDTYILPDENRGAAASVDERFAWFRDSWMQSPQQRRAR